MAEKYFKPKLFHVKSATNSNEEGYQKIFFSIKMKVALIFLKITLCIFDFIVLQLMTRRIHHNNHDMILNL